LGIDKNSDVPQSMRASKNFIRGWKDVIRKISMVTFKNSILEKTI
jgi:hypothetical protein